MKKVLMVIFFCLTFLIVSCNPPNGPDPIVPIVSVNGTYERVYPITNLDCTQSIQICFGREDGAVGHVDAKEVSENVYSFAYHQLQATYPNGIWYKMYAGDCKVQAGVGKKLTLNGYEFQHEFQGEDNKYVKFRLDINGMVYEVFD